jgi:hypothetical protein
MVDPTPIRLDPPGPYILPIAVEFASSPLSLSQSQAQIHLLQFHLEGGVQLRLPTKDTVLQRLYRNLKELIEPQGRGYKRIHPISEIPQFTRLDKNTAAIEFPHRDGISTVLTFPAEVLESLRSQIAEAIERRPQ